MIVTWCAAWWHHKRLSWSLFELFNRQSKDLAGISCRQDACALPDFQCQMLQQGPWVFNRFFRASSLSSRQRAEYLISDFFFLLLLLDNRFAFWLFVWSIFRSSRQRDLCWRCRTVIIVSMARYNNIWKVEQHRSPGQTFDIMTVGHFLVVRPIKLRYRRRLQDIIKQQGQLRKLASNFFWRRKSRPHFYQLINIFDTIRRLFFILNIIITYYLICLSCLYSFFFRLHSSMLM